MPYSTNEDLPDSVRNHLPAHALDIFRAAFNNAYKQYGNDHQDSDLEELCFKIAWAAVKHKYEKGPDGNWHIKNLIHS